MAVKDIDMGWDRIKSELSKMDGSFTKVGLPFNTKAKSPSRKGSGRKPISSSSELIKIAIVQEFGTKDKRIPSRAAIRQAFAQNLASISSTKEKLYGGILDGKLGTKRALGLLGEFQTAKIKAQITKLKSPPNKPSTIKRKRSANPLIDRSQYRNSITHVEVLR